MQESQSHPDFDNDGFTDVADACRRNSFPFSFQVDTLSFSRNENGKVPVITARQQKNHYQSLMRQILIKMTLIDIIAWRPALPKCFSSTKENADVKVKSHFSLKYPKKYIGLSPLPMLMTTLHSTFHCLNDDSGIIPSSDHVGQFALMRMGGRYNLER